MPLRNLGWYSCGGSIYINDAILELVYRTGKFYIPGKNRRFQKKEKV